MTTAPSHSQTVDVILPVRNGSGFIAQALTSLVADAGLISQLIVIDDGSTDDTVRIAELFAPRLPIKIVRQEPLGLVCALNRGLQEATTRYVARMDADDISLPGRLAAQMQFLDENPSVAIVGTQAEIIDADGRSHRKLTRYPLTAAAIRKELRGKGAVFCHPTIMARRDAVLACGGHRAAVTYAEDLDLWLRMAERHDLANLADVFLRYREHPQQVTRPHNWRQALSRDLALWSAAERRAGRPDPLESYAAAPTPNELLTRPDAPRELCELALCHACVERLALPGVGAIPDRILTLICDYAMRGYLGGSRRRRYRLARAAATRLALHGRLLTAAGKYGRLLHRQLLDSGAGRLALTGQDNFAQHAGTAKARSDAPWIGTTP